jgi:hypothetical protein
MWFTRILEGAYTTVVARISIRILFISNVAIQTLTYSNSQRQKLGEDKNLSIRPWIRRQSDVMRVFFNDFRFSLQRPSGKWRNIIALSQEFDEVYLQV